MTRKDYLAKFDRSQRKLTPWEALGISKATFFRRKAKARGETGSVSISIELDVV